MPGARLSELHCTCLFAEGLLTEICTYILSVCLGPQLGDVVAIAFERDVCCEKGAQLSVCCCCYGAASRISTTEGLESLGFLLVSSRRHHEVIEERGNLCRLWPLESYDGVLCSALVLCHFWQTVTATILLCLFEV